MRAVEVYSQIAKLLIAIDNCEKWGNSQDADANRLTIDDLISKNLPHGSGFDKGVKLDYDESLPNKLVFRTAFHHIDENRYYDKWTHHLVIVRPDLAFGFDIKVTGRDYRDIKDYIVTCFGDF